jgi:hypothetical protein
MQSISFVDYRDKGGCADGLGSTEYDFIGAVVGS